MTDLRVEPILNSNTSLVVTWRPPAVPNGIIIGYELNVSNLNSKVLDLVGIPAVPFVQEHTVLGLRKRAIASNSAMKS